MEFLLHVMGAVALFLWGLHMVQTGVDRAWRPELSNLIQSSRGRLAPAGFGFLVSVGLQSSTATGLLAAGFASRGLLTTAVGLSVMLGADLGSALVVRLLSFKIELASPILILAGVALFFRFENHKVRQSGRALAGLGLTLLALSLLSQATLPLRGSVVLPEIAESLGRDPLIALVAGAGFAWLLHSSVAAILVLITLHASGLVPPEAAIFILLGCNLGSSLIPFGLTRSGTRPARLIMAGNLALRGGVAGLWAIGAFVWLRTGGTAISGPLPLALVHLGFNGTLLILGLPLTAWVARGVDRLVPLDRTGPDTETLPGLPSSCLDPASLHQPQLALANIRRELMRMAEIVAQMLGPIPDILKTGDAEKVQRVKVLEGILNRAQSDLKRFIAQIGFTSGEQETEANDLAAIALNLEYAGDQISKSLMKSAETRKDRKLAFSAEGWQEITAIHSLVVRDLALAQNVLASSEAQQARQLVETKSEVRDLVDQSTKAHFTRLRAGQAASASTSNIHLETIRALRSINSLFATIGFAVLSGRGEVLESRLKPAEAV
ncbi:MAG: Na/Pi cotransporter family protein [Hyphomicrobiaceae bacterium]|nr:Na/Pi cotransporter family protein [Hyphomicrobiaceae bacterium]